jgi:hypothetical protein
MPRQYLDRTGGIRAPMSQNNGRKKPMMNMTQWPFLIVMIPSVINRTRYRMMPPPTQISTANLPFVLATRYRWACH